MSIAASRLPHFIVIGAMKSGTTSLNRYLEEHPQIGVARGKETNFFIEEDRWPRGVARYREQFDATSEILGEVNPNYAKFPMHRGVAQRMHSILPEARLIYLVRDPVSRIVSHYMHNVDAGRVTQTLDQVLAKLEDNHYVAVSRYHYQLRQFLEFYSAEQVLVLSLEQLHRDPVSLLMRVCRHVGADDSHPWSPRTGRSHGSSTGKLQPNALGRVVNQAARPVYWALRRAAPGLVGRPLEKPRVSAELRQRLDEALAEDVNGIREFAGESLAGWPAATNGQGS